MTVNQLRRHADSREIAGWIAYFSLEKELEEEEEIRQKNAALQAKIEQALAPLETK